MHPTHSGALAAPLLLRLPDVQRALGVGRSTAYLLIQRGVLSAPVKVGRASLWPVAAVAAAAQRIASGAAA